MAEPRDEGGREVAVIQAAVGVGGALRGEWVYDTATGFVVAGATGTAFSGQDGGHRFRLISTNVPGLQTP